MGTFQLGVGRAVITPPLGSTMAGFAHRKGGAKTILDDLEVRLFWIESEGSPSAACVVTADIIGFSTGLTHRVRESLSERLGLDPAAILLAASHTHSGPHTCENVDDGAGRPEPDYLDSLVEQISDAAYDAKRATRPVHLEVGHGRVSGFAINRRRIENGKSRMAPNPGGVRDDDVSVLVFRDTQTEEVVGLLFHYTCHPTILGTYEISSEYPGVARRAIEKALGGIACGFLPGCFGDVRPACTLLGEKSFRKGTPQDIAAFGQALAEEVVRAVKGATRRSEAAAIRALVTDVALPLEAASEEALLSLQRLDLTSEVSLVAMGGEVCVEYGHAIKRMRSGRVTIPVGYANGMVAYIPTAEMFGSGGYEPVDSVRYFGLPSPFKPELERRIHNALLDLLAD